MNLPNCLEDIKKTALKAGAKVMQSYGKVTLSEKDVSSFIPLKHYQDKELRSDKTALSTVDQESQLIILESLVKRYSFCGIHTEETNEEIKKIEAKFAYQSELPEGKYTFIIDPIDGTRNFLNTNPKNHGQGSDPKICNYFAISINLALGKEIIAGVFYFPALKKMISCQKDGGTYLNGKKITLKPKTNPSFSDPVRIGRTAPELDPLFSNKLNYSSACGNLLALLEQEIDCYFFREMDILDFGCTGVAFRESRGYIGDANSKNIDLTLRIQTIKDQNGNNQFYLIGFTALATTSEYHQKLMKMIKEKGVDLK